jgi:polyisoprenoid-binding protein YceI
MENNMKKNVVSFFIACLSLFFFTVSVQAAETFTLDPQHTYVLWHIKHLGFSTQAGKWYASGTLIFDKDKPENSKVNATIQVADVVTGIAELDKHLKGKLFFDVAQYPTATFVSDKTTMTSKTTAKVHGTLTLHGVSKPIVLDVKFNQVGINPVTDKMTAGFSATTQLKRSDFGINTLLPGLSDEVKINVEAEAYKPNK